ncbi:YciI family protein [Rhizobium sp. A22-96]
MKFLCQVWFESAEIAKLSEEEGRRLTQESIDNDNRLRASGHIVIANALREPETARTVRVRKGEAAVTDGPFAELKEHLGGFVLIEAGDMEEATAIAATFPVARYGMIEVRASFDIRFPDE